jgi:magnesium-transporting ATPase (P-type)
MPGAKIPPMQYSYPGNKISTTRYNLLTYIPVSLFIQFVRVTNVFYVINAILQTIPSIRTNSPLASIIPLAFVVLLGMLREGLADIRRWREDRRTNARLYTRLENPNDLSDKKKVRSDDLRVGDLLEIQEGETIPADCLLIAT